MTLHELNQLATKSDLQELYKKIIEDLHLIFSKSKQKEFYKPKEFSDLTGLKYSTVIYYCNTGQLKARQNHPKGAWQIYHSEVDRFIMECKENKRGMYK